MRRIVIGLTALFLVASGVSRGQAAAKLEFEVASVRAVENLGYPGPGLVRGGPGTSDPGQVTYEHATLKLLAMQAYSMQDFQVVGPGWIESERYTIAAKVPEGTSKDQFRAMLRNLLERRFQLKVHQESRIFSVYELSVGKNGSKMRVSPDDPKLAPMTAADGGQLKYVDGIPQFPPGRIGFVTGAGAGGVMVSAAHQPISKLTEFLKTRVSLPTEIKPVIDKTGLTGNYDFALRFMPPVALSSAGVSDPEPDVFTALEHHLGLKLEEKKAPLDVLVIDQAEKTPAGN